MLTLIQLQHVGGPSSSTRNSLYRYVKKQIQQRRAWGSTVYFWRKASTNGDYPMWKSGGSAPHTAVPK
jgi:hypothetical protein